MASITRTIAIKGMHCKNCKSRVERAISGVDGVKAAEVDWKAGRGTVTYEEAATDTNALVRVLDEIGYGLTFVDEKGAVASLERRRTPRAVGMAFAIIGLIVITYIIVKVSQIVNVPAITPAMSLSLLFVVGLLTGFHCVGMCGGFVVGVTAKDAERGTRSIASPLMYGAGKLFSYTVMGGLFGFIGSLITVTPLMRGVVGVAAGLFLLVYGLSMLDIFPWTKKIRIPLPAGLDKFMHGRTNLRGGALVVGLLNGLMIACGPLQAVLVMAAGTGSAREGAISLLVFGLGTLPVMMGFAFATSIVSARATRKILVASGFVVMALGVIMINRGLTLAGGGVDIPSPLSLFAAGPAKVEGAGAPGVEMKDGYQIIRMDVTRYGWEPDRFVLKKGVPTKWIITGKEINSCNNAIVVPDYGLNFSIKKGEQVIEFTPTKDGVISWSCWMGMIPGTFVVTETGGATDGTGGGVAGDDGAPVRGVCRMGGGCCGGRVIR